MDENKSNFRKELILVLVDKLVIAIIILAIGFFINKTLKNIEQGNTKETEYLKNQLSTERENTQNLFSIYRDSIQNNFLAEQQNIESYFSIITDNIARNESNRHEERMQELQKDNKIETDRLSADNIIRNELIRKSSEVIAEVWTTLYGIKNITRIIQEKRRVVFSKEIEELISSINFLNIKGIDVIDEIESKNQLTCMFILDVNQSKVEEQRSSTYELDPSAFNTHGKDNQVVMHYDKVTNTTLRYLMFVDWESMRSANKEDDEVTQSTSDYISIDSVRNFQINLYYEIIGENYMSITQKIDEAVFQPPNRSDLITDQKL